ncbi:MAG: electron transport complex subunit RsxC [Clostridia bacterium]|nr:electron transport complex subunit RsxC [Clostridia bacterium]
MAYTFKGGVHPGEHKLTERSAITNFPAPAHLCIPLQQHIGAPAKALVSVGDKVCVGTVLGDTPDALCVPVHSPVSGTVTAISARVDAMGRKVEHVEIDNDFERTRDNAVEPFTKPILEASAEELIELIRRAGICGMGGAGFPTYAKLKSALNANVDKLIINACECEPYLTADHRLLLEDPAAVIGGIKIVMRILDLGDATIAIEDNKRDAALLLRQTIQDELIRVHLLKTKYPQGDERQIIYAITSRQIPAGKLPSDVGAVVLNAATCAAIYSALVTGMPLIDRIVTVTGDCVQHPMNLRVPFGTSFADLFEYCGGFTAEPDKIVTGGPMMGSARFDADGVVTKTTSGLLALKQVKDRENGTCIHCGKCAEVCPMYLSPLYFAAYAKVGEYTRALEFDVMSCVECGACAHICPGAVPLVQYIRTAKTYIREHSPKK